MNFGFVGNECVILIVRFDYKDITLTDWEKNAKKRDRKQGKKLSYT